MAKSLLLFCCPVAFCFAIEKKEKRDTRTILPPARLALLHSPQICVHAAYGYGIMLMIDDASHRALLLPAPPGRRIPGGSRSPVHRPPLLEHVFYVSEIIEPT
jgi:hypothetical protein